MVKHKFLSRLKAAIVGAAMIATSLAVPVVNYTSYDNVIAAETTKKADNGFSFPHTFVADGVEDGPRQGNVALTGELRFAKTLVLNFTTTSKEEATIEVYGFGTTIEPDYWTKKSVKTKTDGSSSFEFRVPVPDNIQGKLTKIGIGIWYPDDGSEFTLKSIEADGLVEGATTGGGPTSVPTSLNNKSGTYSFTDNGDGTATIISTLSAQYTENGKTEFDILLTQGWDEETHYAPFKDENGDPYPEWKQGDKINSHKFKFTDFGIDDLENIKFQSFEYVVTTEDYNMDYFMYGGGVNVVKGSPADTETVMGKDGYWYNDHSEKDIAANSFEIKVHGPYEAEYCGEYAKLVWDVPEEVQPYIEYSNSNNSVGFQYWWGTDNSKIGESEDGEETNYAVIPEVHLRSCTATYTRTMTVPYNTTIKGNAISSLGSADLNIGSLQLGKRDKLSAIRFHVKSASELQKFVSGFGIAMSKEAGITAFNTKGTWYQPGNICVINNGPEFDVMLVFPENIINYIYGGEDAHAEYSLYYADKEGGEEVSSVSIPTVEYYVFRTQEADLVVYDDQGIEVPDVIELEVGDEYQLHPNVKDCDYVSSRPNVASVDGNGLISALERGITVVTVTTPEGQTRDIQVRVTDDSDKPTEATRKYDPDPDIDWEHVLWGDVDVNGAVDLADVTELSKYLLSPKSYPLKNATARENADCKWDHKIDSPDLSKLIEYNLGKITMDELGPEDWEIRRQSPYYRSGTITG